VIVRGSRGARLIVVAAFILVVALVSGACAATTTAVPSRVVTAAPPSPSPSPGVTQASVVPSALLSAGPGAASPGASPGASPAVPIDPSLLAILPASVSGQGINEVPEIEASLMTDPSLVQNASSLAVALGINMNTGDFAYVAVIQLKPLVFSNAFFLSWRQSYDEGACSQSDGIKGTSTTTIAGRQVYVGSCNGGAKTYHIHLVAPDRLVSITSVGTGQYGALVLASLKP
jgi:hypothetical protein